MSTLFRTTHTLAQIASDDRAGSGVPGAPCIPGTPMASGMRDPIDTDDAVDHLHKYRAEGSTAAPATPRSMLGDGRNPSTQVGSLSTRRSGTRARLEPGVKLLPEQADRVAPGQHPGVRLFKSHLHVNKGVGFVSCHGASTNGGGREGPRHNELVPHVNRPRKADSPRGRGPNMGWTRSERPKVMKRASSHGRNNVTPASCTTCHRETRRKRQGNE